MNSSNYHWKIGDKVRPIGMPNYYIITEDVSNQENNLWKMEIVGGRYFDIIPKNVEYPQNNWEKNLGIGEK